MAKVNARIANIEKNERQAPGSQKFNKEKLKSKNVAPDYAKMISQEIKHSNYIEYDQSDALVDINNIWDKRRLVVVKCLV